MIAQKEVKQFFLTLNLFFYFKVLTISQKVTFTIILSRKDSLPYISKTGSLQYLI